MSGMGLSIEVPVASFRMPYAREYAESYEIPPPATVYGMLLSLVGEEDRYRHIGARLAIARPSGFPEPARSVVLRTFRRIKKKPVSDPTNARPDFQEILTGIYLVVWLDSNTELETTPTLAERLKAAFSNSEAIGRFGGLSLGESRDLVDSVSLLPNNNAEPDSPYCVGAACYWLKHDPIGPLTMPYWVDHVGSAKTRWDSYRLVKGTISEPDAEYWIEIGQSA
jgi:CRISPR-associated protein Cas5t